MNRRDLFQLAAGAAAFAFEDNVLQRVRAAARATKDRAPEEMAQDEDYWSEIRQAYTVDRNVINFNNGHVGPSPKPVQDALRRNLEYSDMGPYHTMIVNLERQVETVRRRLAEAAGCD